MSKRKEIVNTKTGEKVFMQIGVPDSNGDIISPNCKFNLPQNFTIKDHDLPPQMAQSSDAYSKEIKRVKLENITLEHIDEHQPTVLPPDRDYIPESNLSGCRSLLLWTSIAAAILIALFLALKHH